MKQRSRGVIAMRSVGVLVLVLVVGGMIGACGGGSGTATSPTPTASTPAATAPPTSTATQTLYTLGGRVVDGTTSAAIGGATLSIADGVNAGKTATTDASGNYSFTELQLSGFTINAAAGAYLPLGQGVTLPSAQPLNFSLTQRSFAGDWTGTVQPPGNAAPLVVRFTVSSANTVTVLQLGICRGLTASVVSTTNTGTPPLPITGGRFTQSASAGFVRSVVGTFTSDTTASGTSEINLSGQASFPCGGTYTLSWTATKQ